MSGLVYDKKQLPQVIGLGALSAGLLGFFGLKMITPPPTQAAPPQGTTASSTATDSTPSGSAATDSDAADSTAPDAGALLGASPPSDSMRDPFAEPDQPVVTTSAAVPAGVAGAKPAGAAIPGLPGLNQVMPLPVPRVAAAPTVWSVTGVVCSDDSPADSLAIFRSGDERRYVRLGSMVDENTRLIGIDRGGVTVARGHDHIRMALGVSAAPPAGMAPAPAAPSGAPLPPGTVIQNAPSAAVTDSAPGSATPADVPALPPLPTQVNVSSPAPPGGVPVF